MLAFRDITNIDLLVLSNELQILEGSRVRKVYQYSDNEFKIKFAIQGSGSIDVAILLPKTIHITKQSKESPPEPPQFAMILRKYLENKKIEWAKQWNLDRIFVFQFAEFKLIAEFFGKGNLILVDSDNKIITVSRPEETKVRKIGRGEIYSLPEEKRKSPDKLPSDFYREAMQEKERDKLHLIAFLSQKVNFPPFYWEEILFRSGVEPLEPLAKCNEEIFSLILKHTKELLQEIDNPKPVIYSDGKYSILPLQKKKESIEFSFDSLSGLMDKIYSESSQPEISKEVIEKQEKIKRKLQQQMKHSADLKSGTEDKKKSGEQIISNERNITQIIEEYKRMKKENKKTEEIEGKLSQIFGSEVKVDKGKLSINFDN